MYTNALHVKRAKIVPVAALCLALAALPLAACSGQQAASDGASPAPASEANSSTPTSQAAELDFSNWKTLGDAFAAQTESMASSWNEQYYVTMFKVGDRYVRAVGKVDADTQAKLDGVDWSTENVTERLEQAAAGAQIASIEDITSEVLSAEDLAQLTGKTGRELVDDGWTFESYNMYGGPQTGATFAKGSFAYSLTFDVTTPEDKTEDEGASVMDAKVVEAEFQGASNAATDPNNPV